MSDHQLSPAAAALLALDAPAHQLARAAANANTARAYTADLRDFEAWCADHGEQALPASPVTIANYLAHLARSGRKASTIRRRLSSIGTCHRLAGYSPPPTKHLTVQLVWRGIRRELGLEPERKVALDTDAIRVLVATCDRETLAGCRDAAILLFDYSGAFQRSELVELDWGDVRETPDGVLVHVRRGQADQDARGRDVGIVHGEHDDTCPVLALTRWLEMSGIADGPLFRSLTRRGRRVLPARLTAQSVALVVKRAVRQAGLGEEALYAAHSLRRGHAVTALRNGAPRAAIRKQTGLSDLALEPYVAAGTVFAVNSSAYLDL